MENLKIVAMEMYPEDLNNDNCVAYLLEELNANYLKRTKKKQYQTSLHKIKIHLHHLAL